jgi:hypothetical protein
MLLVLSLAAAGASLSGCASGPEGSTVMASQAPLVPQIDAVDVQVEGSGPGAAVSIHADATSPSGAALAFFWSGTCISGVLQGSPTITLSRAGLAAEAPAGTAIDHVVVQDATGVAATADAVLTIADGTVQGTLSSPVSATHAAECLGAQAQCAARCNAGGAEGTTNADCLAGCGASLATCAAE